MKNTKNVLLAAVVLTALVATIPVMANSARISHAVASDSPYAHPAERAGSASGARFQIAVIKTDNTAAGPSNTAATVPLNRHMRR